MTVFNRIRQWAQDRNLIEGSNPASQMLKLTEELGELANAINKNKPSELADSIGDAVVVLTIIAEMYGFNIEYCIEQAYEEIKDRKGRMINGTFVKEADLPPEEKAPPAPKKFKYKGIEGSVAFSQTDKVWWGCLTQICVRGEKVKYPIEAVILYEGDTLEELKVAFQQAVEEYLD